MGYSLDEFVRVLPLAMRDWHVNGEAPDWRVDDTDGLPIARIHVQPAPSRVMGVLSLPVLNVRIDLGDAPAATRTEFLLRFERGFHRGGG